MANASTECPILADALPMLNISRTECCSSDFDDPISCWNGRIIKVGFRNCAVNGPLSPLLANLTDLLYFRLDNCKVTGSIPSWISAWQSLNLLSLAENELSGPLPSSLERLPSLLQLNLRRNSFSGEIRSVQNVAALRVLDLSDNLLTGPIPQSLAALDQLGYLHLNGNRLYGPIPAEFERSLVVVVLELHQNFLTGPVPILWSPFLGFTFGGNCIDEKDLMNASTSTSIVQKSKAECQVFYRALTQTSSLPQTTIRPTLFTSTSIPASSIPSSSPSPISTITAITISFSVLLVIIAIAAGLIVYRRRRNSSLVDAQAKSPSSIPARSISSPNIQPLPTTRRTFPPGSTSNLKQVNSSFFSFDPNLAEESRAKFTPSAHLHGDDPSSIINITDSKDLGTSTIDDNDAADDKQENLFASTSFTPISNKAVEAGMILSAVEPAIQQSSTDLVLTNAESWSCEEVSTFLVNCGFDESVVDTFEDANVDGQKILVLTDMELVEMNFAEENTRAMVRFAIERLKFIQGRGDSSDVAGGLGAEMPPEYS